MADSVEDALNDAIAELESKPAIKQVTYSGEQNDEQLPGKWISKLLHVMHIMENGGVTFSHQIIYINQNAPYEYIFHYGGPTKDWEGPTEKFFKSKFEVIKSAKDFVLIEFESIDENKESAVIVAYKEKADKNAKVYKAKVWKTGATTFDYQIIEVKDDSE